jgi:tetratricopeptide (TPR) repeat protein
MINDDKSIKNASLTDKSKFGTKNYLPKVDGRLDINTKILERMKKQEGHKPDTTGINSSNLTNKEDSKQEEDKSINTNTHDAVSVSHVDITKNKKKEKPSINILNIHNPSKRLSIKHFQPRYTLKHAMLKPKFVTNLFDKLNEVLNIRNKLTEDYAKFTIKTYHKGKKEILSKWKSALKILQTSDVRLFLVAMLCLGDLYVEFDDFETAKHIYFSYKFFANYLELPEEVMQGYEALGNVYKFLYQYHMAIKCYKKQIEIAWILNDKVSELRAYDNIGIQYFYLGNREKAKYYHERMLYGRSEAFCTDVRKSITDAYKNKNFHLFNDDKYVRIQRDNDGLVIKLKESLALFGDTKDIDLENIDIIKNQETMNNSFISEIDMSFSIIPEK